MLVAEIILAWFLLSLVVAPLLGRVISRIAPPDRSDDRFYGES